MALKGIGNATIAYVPEIERDNAKDPTIFHIKPRNTKSSYTSLNKYQDATEMRRGKNKINAKKMYEADKADFLEFCTKVENYEFSNKFKELAAKKVIKEITSPNTLSLLVEDIDPAVFQEVQNAANDYSYLKEGEKKDLKS